MWSEVVTYEVRREAKSPRRHNAKTRLCSNSIVKLREHLRLFRPVSVCECQVCNNNCFWKYMVCPGEPAVCVKQKIKDQRFTCAFHFHNDEYFGLYLSDHQRCFHKTKESYKTAMKCMVKKNGESIKIYRDRKSRKNLGLKS